ncbi:DMT family transporter [Alicyclobacillus sp. SO9]|uniref:DMT family transporter n=1 Tax=Alicyclobacillus sp. SO9 TaxID=2665646 RepID=UPI0018E8CA88|nr:DMT family transporter [Alicyclobacillus sp. SO9]QQE80181.1 DMT family transporter [Alicyclobacillus sp. SO9]
MAYFMLVLAAALWGGNYVVGRVLVSHVVPGFILEARWVIASLLLIALYHKRALNEFRFLRQSLGRTIFLALLGPVLFPTFLYIGEQYTTAVNASMFLATSPAIVLIINALVFKERITLFNVFGVLSSTIGVFFVLSQGHISNILGLHIGVGDLWALGSAVAWGIYSSFLRTKHKQMSVPGFTTFTSVLGSLMLIPFAAIDIGSHTVHWHSYMSLAVTLGILFLALGPSVASYTLWNKGVSLIGATRSQIFTHLVPFFGIVFSVAFLQTPLYIYDFIGAAFIISGIVLSSRKAKTIQTSAATSLVRRSDASIGCIEAEKSDC